MNHTTLPNRSVRRTPRRATRRVPFLVAIVGAVLVAVSSPAVVMGWTNYSFSSTAEDKLLTLINQARASAGKAALMSFTRSMAAEFAPFGIRVNALAPGPVDTDMMRKNPPDAIAGMVGGTLMNRLATPDEMVGAALLLTSGAGSYMTGQVVIVDGGGTPR